MAIGKFLLLGAKGLKTLTSINNLLKRPPQKPLTAMSRQAPWEVFAVAVDVDSPSIGCTSGSTLTSWQISVNRDHESRCGELLEKHLLGMIVHVLQRSVSHKHRWLEGLVVSSHNGVLVHPYRLACVS